MVLAGFMAAWFLAASPINRSSSVKETNEGVVKLPCSLATNADNQYPGLSTVKACAILDVLISTLVPS